MSDRRLTPDPHRITGRTRAQIALPVADLCRAPGGPRDRQLLMGAHVTVLDTARGWSYVQADRDGYCGYVKTLSLARAQAPTHKVTAPSSHAYLAADMKSPERMALSFGSVLTALQVGDRFIETSLGHVPLQHVQPAELLLDDPADVATRFLGTPYLWGGNSCWGIDCSGLVQAAYHACGIDCPGDSDMQETTLGAPVSGRYRRNDLLFWKGHVALVCDDKTLIHANAHVMAVAFEPITAAIARIEAQGDGPLTGHRRLPCLPNRKKSSPKG